MKVRIKVLNLAAILLTVVFATVSQAELPVTQGLIVHLDGSHVDVSGDEVVSMTDQSGKGNDAVADSVERRPLLVQDETTGYPVIDFQGSKALQISTDPSFNFSSCTMFIVYKFPKNPDTSSWLGVLTNSYAMSGWSFNSSAVRQTLNIYSQFGKMKTGARGVDGAWCGETVWPFLGYSGWNLAVMVWDPSNSDTFDGDVDMYLNPSANDCPEMEASRSIRWYEGTDEAGDAYVLQNHVMTVLGARPNYLDANSGYPGNYDYDAFFNGMIAEVIIYSEALTACELEPVVEYLDGKYSYGSEAPLLDLPLFSECEYWLQTGYNLDADLNGNCKVDMEDFAELANKWLQTY